MVLPIYIVDAFTDQPFKGNPAAVCVTAEPLEDERMQNIAAEINLSETAFLFPQKDGYSLRWFTPRRRSGFVRPRYFGECAYFVGNEAAARRAASDFPHQKRAVNGKKV